MKKLVILFVVTLAMLGGTSVPSSASPTTKTCSVVWGSLPKVETDFADGPIAGIRTGRHECFDRFVVDLSATSSGYRVEYVSRLTQDGSGASVPVQGGAILSVVVLANPFDDNGNLTIEPSDVNASNVSGYRTFREVVWGGSFESYTTFGLGVRARLPFRAFTLDGPGDGSRIVVDVAHHW